MRGCPFENNAELPCPVSDGPLRSVFVRPCESESYGRNCSAILTQIAVLSTTGSEGVRSGIDDMHGEITGFYKPMGITVGEAPQEVNNDVIKCKFPVRSKRPIIEGGVAIHHFDLICTLQNYEMLPAANWYNSEMKAKVEGDEGFDWWVFAEADGELWPLAEAKDTVAVYDQSFMVGSAVLHNAMNPPLIVVEHLRRAARG